jgi:glycosyltransferase involved in cell wall biosynthesis
VSGLVVVLPVIGRETADICIDSLLRNNSAAGLSRDEILIVDNSRKGWGSQYGLRAYRDPDDHNLGVARSWNVGAREVLDRDLDYLVIMSTAMRFGPELHTTWKRQMEEFWGAKVIEADGHSWHLIALHRTCFEKVGFFDENFYPAYFEQTDWCYRLRMAGWEHGFIRVWVNALSQGHALHNHLVSCPAEPLLDYYAQKWGGKKGEETFVQPFGSKPLGYWELATIPELAARYGLTEWW